MVEAKNTNEEDIQEGANEVSAFEELKTEEEIKQEPEQPVNEGVARFLSTIDTSLSQSGLHLSRDSAEGAEEEQKQSEPELQSVIRALAAVQDELHREKLTLKE